MGQAIAFSTPIEITILSNDSEQNSFDESTSTSLIQNLLPEVIQAYQQEGSLAATQTVQLSQTSEGAIAAKAAKSCCEPKSTPSKSKKSGKHRFFNVNGVKAYPCSYISCKESFSNTHKRMEHHKTHFKKELLQQFETNHEVPCPECGKIVVASIAAILSHMFRGGCKK